MVKAYIFKQDGATYLCSNEACSMHLEGRMMIGDHYVTGVVINGDSFEDAEEFNGDELLVEADRDEVVMAMMKGKIPPVKIKRG